MRWNGASKLRASGGEAVKPTPWIIVHDGTRDEDAYAMECLRCGEKQRFALPINVTVYYAAARAFEKIHAKCKEKP